MFERVLILSVSAGAGHLRAAEAMEKAFVQTGAAREVLNVDTLKYTNKLFQNLYSKAYIEVVNKAPDLLGWLYDSLDRPWKNERRRLAFDRLNTRPFVKLLKEFQPDVAVCTHFLLEEGAAIRCNNLPVLGWKIDRLLDEPGRLAQLQANAHHLGRPRAALDIVEALQTLLG